MTICIAALCDGGRACVVAADREITIGLPLNIGFEHHEKKIEQIGSSCVLMTSGNALVGAEVTSRTIRGVRAASADMEIQRVGLQLRDTYMAVHMERAEQVILVPRGLTLAEFRNAGAQKLLPQVYQAIDNLFWSFTLNTEFIVAGVDGTGGHIGWVHYHGLQGAGWLEWFDKLGYQAIGSGSSHAGVLLALNGQHRGLEIPDTVYNALSAKVSAEVAPGVGPATDMAIITSKGVEFLTEEMIRELRDLRTNITGQRSETVAVDVRKVLGQNDGG